MICRGFFVSFVQDFEVDEMPVSLPNTCSYHLLGQWLNFKLFGITYLVGKIKFKPFFFRVHWLSEIRSFGSFFFASKYILRRRLEA